MVEMSIANKSVTGLVNNLKELNRFFRTYLTVMYFSDGKIFGVSIDEFVERYVIINEEYWHEIYDNVLMDSVVMFDTFKNMRGKKLEISATSKLLQIATSEGELRLDKIEQPPAKSLFLYKALNIDMSDMLCGVDEVLLTEENINDLMNKKPVGVGTDTYTVLLSKPLFPQLAKVSNIKVSRLPYLDTEHTNGILLQEDFELGKVCTVMRTLKI